VFRPSTHGQGEARLAATGRAGERAQSRLGVQHAILHVRDRLFAPAQGRQMRWQVVPPSRHTAGQTVAFMPRGNNRYLQQAFLRVGQTDAYRQFCEPAPEA
jgi:hypothetical protein